MLEGLAEVRHELGTECYINDSMHEAAGATETLGEIMRDPKQTGAARVAAANSILDRAWGKATQHITTERVQELTDEELAQELEATLEALRRNGRKPLPN